MLNVFARKHVNLWVEVLYCVCVRACVCWIICAYNNIYDTYKHIQVYVIIFNNTDQWHIYSMLSQLKYKGFRQKTEVLILSRKKARGRKDWDNNCDRYLNKTALYITISTNALLISNYSENKISFQNVLCHWTLVHKKSLYAACENGRWKKWLMLTKLYGVDHKGFNFKT